MAVRGHDGRPADCPLILGAGGDAVVDLDAVDGAGDPFSFAAYTVSAELLDTLGQSLSTPVTATVTQGAEPRLTFDGDELETLLDGRTRWSGSWRLLLDTTPLLAGPAEVWHPGAGAVSTTDTISATVDATTVALTISSVVELGEGGGGVSDHGALTGLTDDDHTQYLLADGSRTLAGNLTVTGTVDGRDVAADGTKLDGIEASADVTDTANVTAAGALMDSEVTNLAQVKAFDSADYATAAQGSTADTALQPGADADDIDDTTSTNKFTTAADVSKLAGIEASADVTDTANVTAAGALMDSEVTNLADVKAFDPADYEASGAVATHEADTTSVHGITDTSALLDTSDVGVSVEPHVVAPLTEATTARTMSATDHRRHVRCTNASLTTITLPTGLATGVEAIYRAIGAGGVTLDSTAVTLGGSAPQTSAAQNGAIHVIHVGSDVFDVLASGDPV